MNAKANERIEKVRATIQKERQAVADLSSKAPDLKPQLLDVTSALDLVEGGCLSPKILQEPRTDQQWTWWLNSTSALLDAAIRQREYISALSVKFGPDVKTFR
jgi:hypothetical protein